MDETITRRGRPRNEQIARIMARYKCSRATAYRRLASAPARRDKAMLGNSGYARRDRDFYRTEAWVTEALLAQIALRGIIWEPAAGDGAIVAVLQAHGLQVEISDIVGDDLGLAGCARADFLTAET